jgi:hypothetical protein
MGYLPAIPLLFLLACTSGLPLGPDTGTPDNAGSDSDSASSDSDSPPPLPDDLEARVHDVMASIIVLSWTQPAPATVQAEYSFDDGVWLTTPSYDVDAGARQLLLLGIPFETEITWRLLVDGVPAAKDATIETGATPSGIPDVDHFSGDDASWDAQTKWVLVSIASNGTPGASPWTFIIDRKGRLVWGHKTPTSRTTFCPQVSFDGREILVDYNSWWGAFDGGSHSQVARLDIEDTTLGTYDTPGLIHPFTQTGDGTIVWSAAQGGASYSGEVLAYLDGDGDTRNLFDCNAFSHARGGDNCGANTVFWNPADGHFLYSIYTQDTVIEVDAEGAPIRWFGHLSGAWNFEDRETEFWWQHGAQYLPDGHLLLSTRRTETAEETVIREYELDEAHDSLVQTWTFGEGEGVYAEILGEARRLPGGNTLHNFGSTPRIRENTPEGDVVWDASWDESGTMGRMQALGDLYPLWSSSP